MTPEQLAKSGTEHGEQRALMQALLDWNREVWDHTFAIPNGGQRDKITAGKLKAEGVKAGVPDLMVAWPTALGGRLYAGLFVEMKRPADREKERRQGVLGKAQDPWHEKLRARGYAVVIAYTWSEALEYIKQYFGQAQ